MTRLYNALQQYQKRLDSGSMADPVRQGAARPGGARFAGPRPNGPTAGGPISDGTLSDRPVSDRPVSDRPVSDRLSGGPIPGGPIPGGPMPGGPVPGGPIPGASVHGPSMRGGTIPGAGIPGAVSRLITTTLPRENLIALYGSIEQRLTPDTPRIVQVTSATKGEGTTTVARDLAVTVAEVVRKRVLLISVIRPGMHDFAAATPVGLEAVMTGSASQGDVIEAVPGLPLFETTLSAVGAGNGHLFDAPAMDRALRSALAIVDLVIVDTPPVLNGFVAAALARHCGGTVLVVEAERVRAPKVDEARRTIEAHGGRVIGAVMNKRRWHIPELVYRRLQ